MVQDRRSKEWHGSSMACEAAAAVPPGLRPAPPRQSLPPTPLHATSTRFCRACRGRRARLGGCRAAAAWRGAARRVPRGGARCDARSRSGGPGSARTQGGSAQAAGKLRAEGMRRDAPRARRRRGEVGGSGGGTDGRDTWVSVEEAHVPRRASRGTRRFSRGGRIARDGHYELQHIPRGSRVAHDGASRTSRTRWTDFRWILGEGLSRLWGLSPQSRQEYEVVVTI